MNVALSVLICFVYAVVKVSCVPPNICFQQFRWEDCGMAPKPVIYYYKSGSRCEVGMWRGCLPNQNMFADEYECVQTCIFSLRAGPDDFHNFQAQNEIEVDTTPSAVEYTETTAGEGTSKSENATGSGTETGATSEGDGSAATVPAEGVTGGDNAASSDAGEASTDGAGETGGADAATPAPE